MEMNETKVTRLEVIDVTDETKRMYVKWNCKIEPSIQDGGKTLKIFVEYDDKEDSLK